MERMLVDPAPPGRSFAGKDHFALGPAPTPCRGLLSADQIELLLFSRAIGVLLPRFGCKVSTDDTHEASLRSGFHRATRRCRESSTRIAGRPDD